MAVVGELHLDLRLQPGLAHQPLHPGLLFPGHGHRGQVAAGAAHRLQSEATPAAADFKDVVVRADAGAVQDRVDLVALGRLQAVPGIEEQAARVAHGRVEEQPVEVVAQVVVGADVAPAALRGVVAAQVAEKVDRPSGQGRPQPPVVDRLLAQGEQAEQGHQVRAVPVAVRVGLTETDVRGEHGPLPETVAVHGHGYLRLAVRVTEDELLALRRGQGQAAVVELGEESAQHPPAQALQRAGSGLADGVGRRGLRPGVDRQLFAEMETRRLGEDAREGEHGAQRVAEHGAGQDRWRECLRPAGERGLQGRLAVDRVGDGQGQALAVRRGKVEAVDTGAREKGRDVKGLVGDRVIPDAGEQVEVGVAEGVVHLDEHREHLAGRVQTEEKAGRVEHVVELAQGGDEHDSLRLRGDAVLAQDPADLVPERGRARVEVVAVVQGDGSDAVVAEPPALARQVVHLVQVQGVKVQAVAEFVPGDAAAGVAQLSGVEPRFHRWPCRWATAWWALRTASSWKP